MKTENCVAGSSSIWGMIPGSEPEGPEREDPMSEYQYYEFLA